MEGSDGGRASWSYREETESSSYTISSSAGTVPTDFTSSASRLSLTSMEAARHLEEMEKEEQMRSLVKESFGAPSAKSSIGGGDMSVLERWLTELGGGWILHLAVADGAPEAKLEHTLDASRWMLALTEIMDTFRFTTSLYWRRGSTDKEEPAMESEKLVITDQLQFASFTQQAMLKVLGFIDVIVARNHNIICDTSVSLVEPYRKLHILLRVRDTLSKALSEVRVLSYSPPSAEVGRIHSEMMSVLSVKEGKVGEAIWSAMEENRNRILESVDNSSGSQIPQVTSDIHEATESLMEYVLFLRLNFLSVYPIVSEAASLGKYLPRIGDVTPLRSLVVEMMSCVQEKLANMSEKFADQSLGFLFLINNLSFIGDRIQFTYFNPESDSYKESLAGEVEAYMERYMQVSWEPVLSCLFNPTPLLLWKTYSPLSKFESKFHRTYTTQKLWKVPDPKLRKTLREAITDKIVPGYTKYIEDNSVATPKFTPQNLQEMLQELFEG